MRRCCSQRKKTDNPREGHGEGWEDGTPPPHRDFLRRGECGASRRPPLGVCLFLSLENRQPRHRSEFSLLRREPELLRRHGQREPTRLPAHTPCDTSSRLASRHDPALVSAPQLPVLSHLRPALHLHVHVPQIATALNVSRKEARVRVATTTPPASGMPRHQLSTRAGRLFSLVYKGAVIGAQSRRARSCTHAHPTPPRGVGTRLSPWVSASCLLMAAWTLFF